MNKTKILGIAPYEGIQSLMKQVAEHRDDIDLTVFVGDRKEGLNIASKYTPNDFDIIVSRGGTAELIQKSCSLPVVEISLSAMDILRSIKLAQNFNNKYALVGFPSITKNAHFLCELLQYDIDIYTIHDEQEASNILATLSQNGYYMVLCDMITYSLAQRYGLTAILITSGSESIEAAFDQAVETKKTYNGLTAQIDFYKTLLEDHPHSIYVYNEASELIYYSKNDYLPEVIKQEMQNKISFVLSERNAKIYKEVSGLLYAISGFYKVLYDKPHIVFYINARKVPLSLIKDGIRYLNKEEANDKFYKSFYGITQSIPDADSSVRQYAESNLPVMILGEEGTGKEQLACLLYAKSKFNSNPLAVIDCSRFSSKGWFFLTEDNNSPLSDTSTTIYIKNMEVLPDQQYDELFAIIQNLNLYNKNRMIFTFTINSNENTLKRYTQIINHYSCLTIRVPALRNRAEDIPDLTSIYISTLNMRMAKEILGFEASALSVMQSYDWPGNYNQFKKILNELITISDNPYIKTSAVTKLLYKESLSNPSKFESSLANKTLEEISLDVVRQVFTEENGNHSATAKRLGLSRTTLWRMLQKIKI